MSWAQNLNDKIMLDKTLQILMDFCRDELNSKFNNSISV